MANNNNSHDDINSLKASFCRQHFPDLLQFLRNFNISSELDDSGNEINHTDDFNMHFLLQAYNVENISKKRNKETEEDYNIRKSKEHDDFLINQRNLLENCYWMLENVQEADVLLAVEEYFSIISGRQDTEELTSILVKNILTNKEASTIFTDETIDDLYQFEDNTTLILLERFGIISSNGSMTLGVQRNAFARFILSSIDTKENPQNKVYSTNLCSRRPEVRFIQAFELLASVRNWRNHEYNPFMSDRFNSYCLYRFILFTHIGLIYIIRRLWNNPEASKELEEEKEYQTPDAFNFVPSDLMVEIRANEKSQTIYDCSYLFEDEKEWHPVSLPPQNVLSFPIKPKKYQLFKIKFKCNEQDYEVVGKLNYYAWDPILNIVVKPPKFVSYSFRGIAGDNKDLEEHLSELFTKFMDIYCNENANNEQKCKSEELLKELSRIEPLLQKIKESSERNEKAINEIKAQICSETQEINTKLDDIRNNITEPRDRMMHWERLFKNALIIVFIFLAGYALYYSIKEPIMANVILFKHPILLSIGALLLTYGTFITPGESWNPLKAGRESGKTKWYTSIITIVLLLSALFVLPYHSSKDFILNYNFIGQDSIQNNYIVKYMDEYLPNEEEMVRSKLALYYADIVGDLEKAKLYSSPMLDMEKFKDGSLVAMYVLYCQKEIPALSQLIDRYKDFYGEDDPDYCDLKGALLVDTLYGYRDVHKGFELLWKAYEAGSITASYNLGYLYSTDESTMEAIEQGRTVQNSYYDLPLAIDLLKNACNEMPRASILLGDIYSDLEMIDSAFYYYEKAITETTEGAICKYASYKYGVLSNILGFKPNDALLFAQSMQFPPALMFSSIALQLDMDIVNKLGTSPYTYYFLQKFKEKDHKSAIRWFEDAIKNGKDWSLKDMGAFQYIPPVVFDHIIIGEKENALAILQKYRKGSNFDMSFINAVELLLGSNSVNKDSLKGMQLMHESAANGCLYSKLFCLYRDTEQSLLSNPSAFIDSKQLKAISKEIPFAHVIESLLLIRAGKMKEAEEAAHMALWKKLPAGALAFEFMPQHYYKTITNGINDINEKDLYFSRKLQEMSLRSTFTMKDRSLLITCILDKALHDKTKKDFSKNFIFWSQVAIETRSYSSQIKLLRIYQDMIKDGYKDHKNIIDPLIRSVLHNMMRGEFNIYPEYISYILHFIKDRKIITSNYYNELLRTYGTYELFEELKKIEGSQDNVITTIYTIPLSFIDDFSLLTDFSYLAGIYTLMIRQSGSRPRFIISKDFLDQFSNDQ